MTKRRANRVGRWANQLGAKKLAQLIADIQDDTGVRAFAVDDLDANNPEISRRPHGQATPEDAAEAITEEALAAILETHIFDRKLHVKSALHEAFRPQDHDLAAVQARLAAAFRKTRKTKQEAVDEYARLVAAVQHALHKYLPEAGPSRD